MKTPNEIWKGPFVASLQDPFSITVNGEPALYVYAHADMGADGVEESQAITERVAEILNKHWEETP